MKHENSLEEKQEQAALYALGALSQHEARAFERQLQEGDREAQNQLASFEKVIEALGYSTTPVQPPAYLFDVLTARIQREAQQPSAEAVPFPGKRLDVAPLAPQQNASPSPGNVVEFKRRSPVMSFMPWALAASLAVCSLLALFAWRNARKETADLQNQVATVRNDAAILQQKVTEDSQYVYELGKINETLRASAHRVIDMPGQEAAPTSAARVYWNESSKQWVVAADLPPAPEGKVYQLWFVTPQAKISAGLLKTDNRGHGFAVVNVPANVTNIAAAAITLEPAGGSPQPTSAIYALGKVS